MKNITLAAIICTIITCQCALAEDWVNNWVQQSTISRPNTYNTQKRGYVTGGKLSVRYNQSNDHLVSISKPHFRNGCGGIDLFGGSLNFLETDRLVDKFERIMGGAAVAYAYGLVLNVLCEGCAKELKSLEAIVDRLNQLQIDDCKATKAVVAYTNNETGVGDSAENSEAITDFMVSSGINPDAKDYYTVTQNAKNKDMNAVMGQYGISKNDLVQGCPDEMKNVYFKEGTLLENMAVEMGMDASRVEFMRALIGDVYISNELDYAVVPACPQNNPTNIDAIIYGDFYHRRNGQCVQDQINISGDVYPSLYDWARENILEISEALANKTPLEPHNDLFINTIPQPILIMVSTDIMIHGNSFEAKQTADRYAYLASILFAHSLMRDLYNDLYKILDNIKISGVNAQSGGYQCNQELKNKAQLLALEMRENVIKYRAAIDGNYKNAINEAMQNSRYAKFLVENKDASEEKILKRIAGQ